jgi:predicted ester cyclase
MATTDPRTVVRRYLEEVVNTGDVARLAEFIAPGYVEVHAGRTHPVGLEGAREHVLGVRRTYPDLRLTIVRQICEGEWVASVVTAVGTHLGEWIGIRPTGKVITMTAVNVDRVVDGRIVEHGGAADVFTPFLEAGAIRPVGPGDAPATSI